jgi:cell division protease FtsH
MTTKFDALKKEFSLKIQTLENAKTQLKKEFIGIDFIIDEVIENVRSWYTMNSFQEKPTVINLWGLTGTGKTSLVKRLLELISFDDRAFRFDLGEKEGGMSFRNSLSDLCENKDDAPIAIILDEFQHSRTIKQGHMREEIENDQNRMVWELIDSGKVSYIDWKSGIWLFEDTIVKLSKLLKAGIEVKNGIVTKELEYFCEEMHIGLGEEKILFFSEKNYSDIIEFAGAKLNMNLKSEVKKVMLKMNGEETINFLIKVLNIAKRPSEKSFTQAIIFILGNIDEAYKMSGNYSADISADEFHKLSLKITVPDIKKALRSRFRDEQIARLGNIHIIYPALSRNAYLGIIKLEIDKLREKMKSTFAIELDVKQSLIDEIYSEGVYPTQGARPLFTTIHQMVKSKISIYINSILEQNEPVDLLSLSVEKGLLKCEFFNGETLKFINSNKITSNLESLRKPKQDEIQAIVAVHESGHAVLSSILLKVVPEIVLSVTSDSGTSGFVFAKSEKDFYIKNELIAKVAVHLGGMIAEEIVFGEGYQTSGASSDINESTNLVTSLLKKHGLGSSPISYAFGNAEVSSSLHDCTDIENEVMQIILEGKKLAKETLLVEKKLLLAMSNHLGQHPRLEKEEIISFIEKYATTKTIQKIPDNFYREKLRMQFQTTIVLDEVMDKNPIIFNRNK